MFSSRRQSAIPGFRLQNYGLKNNPTVTIVPVGYQKTIKRVRGNGFRFQQGYYCSCEIFCIKSFRLMAPLCRQSISPFLKSMRVGTD